MPGYRLRLPQAVHPISAGLKGGLVGGAVMPLPALLWGLLSGHGLWYPGNLLAGMVLPGVGRMSVAELEPFSASLLLVVLTRFLPSDDPRVRRTVLAIADELTQDVMSTLWQKASLFDPAK